MEWTPLMAAIEANDLKMVRLLVEAGANVNQYADVYGKGEEGWKPIEIAFDNPEIKDYLREQGAKERIR